MSSPSPYRDRQVVREKLRDLVIDDGSVTKSVLNAYRLKSELNSLSMKDVRDFPGYNTSPTKKTAERIQEENEPYYKIRTLDPLIVLPQKRFDHRPSAVITANATQSRLKPVSVTPFFPSFDKIFGFSVDQVFKYVIAVKF